MYKISWTITFSKKISFEEKNINYLQISNFENEFSYFIIWELKISWEDDLINYFKKKAEIIDLDISYSKEDKIQFFVDKLPKEWKYELVSFEWELVNFEEIIERFEENYEIVTIREAEYSDKFWNKIIKAEFIY